MVVFVCAIGMAAYTLNERRHIAFDASGEWWCAGDHCGVASCGGCTSLDVAACFPATTVMRGEAIRTCRTMMSSCEDARSAALDDRDLESVGACRVMVASAASREQYRVHAVLAWLLGGLAVALGVAALASRRRRAARPRL